MTVLLPNAHPFLNNCIFQHSLFFIRLIFLNIFWCLMNLFAETNIHEILRDYTENGPRLNNNAMRLVLAAREHINFSFAARKAQAVSDIREFLNMEIVPQKHSKLCTQYLLPCMRIKFHFTTRISRSIHAILMRFSYWNRNWPSDIIVNLFDADVLQRICAKKPNQPTILC